MTARKVSSSAAVCLIKHSVLGFVGTKNVSVKENPERSKLKFMKSIAQSKKK